MDTSVQTCPPMGMRIGHRSAVGTSFVSFDYSALCRNVCRNGISPPAVDPLYVHQVVDRFDARGPRPVGAFLRRSVQPTPYPYPPSGDVHAGCDWWQRSSSCRSVSSARDASVLLDPR